MLRVFINKSILLIDKGELDRNLIFFFMRKFRTMFEFSFFLLNN